NKPDRRPTWRETKSVQRSEKGRYSARPHAKFECISSLDHLASDGLIQLGRSSEIRAYQVHVTQLNGAIFILGIQEVDERHAAVLIRELHSVANMNGLGQILFLVRFQKRDVRSEGRVSAIHIGEHLGFGSLAQLFAAVDINLCAQLFALIMVKDAQRDVDAGA